MKIIIGSLMVLLLFVWLFIIAIKAVIEAIKVFGWSPFLWAIGIVVFLGIGLCLIFSGNESRSNNDNI